MKNINKIMFACLMMTVGYVQTSDDTSADNSSTQAMRRLRFGGSSATYSKTTNFTVYKNMTGYVAGMAGNYNPNTQIAMVNDADGNIVYTFGNVTKFQPRSREDMNRQELDGKQLIGSIPFTPKTSANGKIKSHAMMLDALLFGELQS